jgi:hypothetical protein
MTEQNQKLDEGNTPSAFPSSGLEYTEKGKSWAQAGMTLRDYFAAEAMQTQDWAFYISARETESSIADDARRCYRIADAMMKARTQ